LTKLLKNKKVDVFGTRDSTVSAAFTVNATVAGGRPPFG